MPISGSFHYLIYRFILYLLNLLLLLLQQMLYISCIFVVFLCSVCFYYLVGFGEFLKFFLLTHYLIILCAIFPLRITLEPLCFLISPKKLKNKLALQRNWASEEESVVHVFWNSTTVIKNLAVWQQNLDCYKCNHILSSPLPNCVFPGVLWCTLISSVVTNNSF